MPRQRIDQTAVVTAALEVADDVGLDELTLAGVAERLGVQAPALYNHVEGLDGLRQAIALRATENLAETLREAAVARSGFGALEAVAHAYRRFAHEHPGQYGTTLMPVATSIGTSQDSQTWIGELLIRILESFGLTGEAAVHSARIVHSAIHGFVTLEACGAFTRPLDRDQSFAELVEFVGRGLERAGAEA